LAQKYWEAKKNFRKGSKQNKSLDKEGGISALSWQVLGDEELFCNIEYTWTQALDNIE
jgi:hypothetical protein